MTANDDVRKEKPLFELVACDPLLTAYMRFTVPASRNLSIRSETGGGRSATALHTPDRRPWRISRISEYHKSPVRLQPSDKPADDIGSGRIRSGHFLPREPFHAQIHSRAGPFWAGGIIPGAPQGLLIPTDQKLPPLSLTSERVKVTIEGPVATTTMHQSYRNRSGRDLEAEFIFPLPPGATVRDFSMWVAGKRYKGEAVEASKAGNAYEDIVRRLQDPGLLEYIGRDLWKARVYPVPRNSEQEIEITFSAILPLEADMVSYQYRVRGGQASRSTVKDFTMVVQIRSPDPLGPIYSPSHDVAVERRTDHEAVVSFERNACKLDKDFQLYFAPRRSGSPSRC